MLPEGLEFRVNLAKQPGLSAEVVADCYGLRRSTGIRRQMGDLTEQLTVPRPTALLRFNRSAVSQ